METIKPKDIEDIEEQVEIPKVVKRNWSLIVMLIAGFLIGLGIGMMVVKGRCESIIDYYQTLNASCLLWK